jgi:hypothetical protein
VKIGLIFLQRRPSKPSIINFFKLVRYSIRGVPREVNISKSVVQRTVREVFGYKSYKMYLTQKIYDEDMDLRVEMAELLLPILTDKNNDGLIFFSDEATFHISGIWSQSNPHATVEVEMNSPKLTVWCGMSGKLIVRPFVF